MNDDNDTFFQFMCFMLSIICFLDSVLTYIGLNLGWSEGNKIIIYFMNSIGIEITLILSFIITFISIIILYIIKLKIKKIGWFLSYSILSLLIYRTYVIGIWVGIINTLI